MAAGWAATNTLRKRALARSTTFVGSPTDWRGHYLISEEELALVEAALDADDDLRHWTRRMLQALDGYWLWWDGWQGPRDRYPLSQSTAEDWWSRFEKYRAKVDAALRAVREDK